MKICIYGAGAIGGYLGVQLARAGVDVSLVARGAHLAAMQRQRPQAPDRRRRARGAPALHRQSRRTRSAGLRHHLPEGAFHHRRARPDAAAAWDAHRALSPRSTASPIGTSTSMAAPYRRLDAGEHRSRRAAVARTQARARHRLHRLSRDRDRGARRDPPCLWRPLSARRALGRAHRRCRSGSPASSPRPACRPRCSTASATRSGSSCGAMSASTRSAR